jgi:hypothetical protein
VGGFKIISHWAVSLLELLDKTFALRVTLRHIFEPLYQDRTVLGYVLGFTLRTCRIVLAAIIYAVVIVGFTVLYLSWALFLVYVFYQTLLAFNLLTIPWKR